MARKALIKFVEGVKDAPKRLKKVVSEKMLQKGEALAELNRVALSKGKDSEGIDITHKPGYAGGRAYSERWTREKPTAGSNSNTAFVDLKSTGVYHRNITARKKGGDIELTNNDTSRTSYFENILYKTEVLGISEEDLEVWTDNVMDSLTDDEIFKALGL